MTAVPRASRHWSAARGTGPKRAIARVRASMGLRPAAMCFWVSRAMWNAEALRRRTGHASFMTRPIAVDMRSHSSASTASCRRPAGVSW